MIATFFKTAIALIVSLVVADVIGVIACVFFDVMPIRGSDFSLLPYTIWFVLGIFVGVIAQGWAGSWLSPKGDNWMHGPEAAAIAMRVTLFSALILAALSAFFWWLYWSRNVAGEYFVPDSMSHSLTYFLSALGAMAFFAYSLRSDPKPESPPPA